MRKVARHIHTEYLSLINGEEESLKRVVGFTLCPTVNNRILYISIMGLNSKPSFV